MAGPIAACQHAGLNFHRQPFDYTDAMQVAEAIEHHYRCTCYNPAGTDLYLQALNIATWIVHDSWRVIEHVAALLMQRKSLDSDTVITAVTEHRGTPF